MKTCTVCGKIKSESDFFYRHKVKGKLHSQCKECYVVKRRKIWREHYNKYGSQYRQRAVERNRRLKDERRKQLLQYLKDKRCEQCGANDPRVLEFDHIDPVTKAMSVAQMTHNLLKWSTILEEIDKCQILCANCHKIKTAKEQGWYKNIA